MIKQEQVTMPLHSIAVRERENNRSLSAADLAFWHNDPPEKIIFASSSIRKGLQWAMLLSGLAFPGIEEYELAENRSQVSEGGHYGDWVGKRVVSPQPLSLQTFLDTNIHNGDGALRESGEVLVGYLHDVPIYMVRTEGETKNNFDPIAESNNKINDLRERYGEQDVIFVATDTMSHVSSLLDDAEKLGKPENMPDYPKGGSAKEIEAYLQAYKEKYYPVDTKIRHLSGTVVARVKKGFEVGEYRSEKEVHLDSVVTEDAFEHLIIYGDVGGGGVLQQLFDWTEERIIDQITDPEMKEALNNCETQEQRWLLYCHIAGVPHWLIQQEIAQVAKVSSDYLD
jgi:hypothetical protein